MNFFEVAMRVLQKQGYKIRYDDLKKLKLNTIRSITGLPLPTHNNAFPTQETAPVFFNGKNTDYLMIDRCGLKRSLRHMYNKDELVIKSNHISLRYDFEFDKGPFYRRLTARSGFTRTDLAKAIAKHYQELFDKRKSNGVWVKHLSSVGIYAIHYNAQDNVYDFSIDIK